MCEQVRFPDPSSFHSIGSVPIVCVTVMVLGDKLLSGVFPENETSVLAVDPMETVLVIGSKPLIPLPVLKDGSSGSLMTGSACFGMFAVPAKLSRTSSALSQPAKNIPAAAMTARVEAMCFFNMVDLDLDLRKRPGRGFMPEPNRTCEWDCSKFVVGMSREILSYIKGRVPMAFNVAQVCLRIRKHACVHGLYHRRFAYPQTRLCHIYHNSPGRLAVPIYS